MKRLALLLCLALVPTSALAKDRPIGVIVSTAGADTTNDTTATPFFITFGSPLAVQCDAPAYVCVDQVAACVTSPGTAQGRFVSAKTALPTSMPSRLFSSTIVSSGTAANGGGVVRVVAAGPVNCAVYQRDGNEGGTSQTVAVHGEGMELIQSWQIPAGSTLAWDGGATPNIYLYPDGGIDHNQGAIPAASVFDLTPYIATEVVCQVAAITAAATITVHWYPATNFTSVAASPTVWSDTGAGLVANSAASVFHGVGAGAGSTTLGQYIRDDLMPPAGIIDLLCTGSPSSTMGALECRLYGRR